MEFLHRRGARGYVTFNTLVFENELAEAEQYTRTLIRAGVDAAIVQDVGICRLIRALSPDFPIHVSTQMTITSAAGVEFARDLGCNLVVLARECSLAEIEKMIGGGTGSGHAEPACRWRSSFTAPSAWPTRANASPAKRWADVPQTVENAPRPAACPTNCSRTANPSRLGIASICSARRIWQDWTCCRNWSGWASPRSRSRAG